MLSIWPDTSQLGFFISEHLTSIISWFAGYHHQIVLIIRPLSWVLAYLRMSIFCLFYMNDRSILSKILRLHFHSQFCKHLSFVFWDCVFQDSVEKSEANLIYPLFEWLGFSAYICVEFFIFNSDNFLVIALCSFKLLMFVWNIYLTLFSSVYSTSCNMSFIFVMFPSLFFFYCPKCYHLTFQWILFSYLILSDLSNFFFEFYISQGLYLLKFIWEHRGVFVWHFLFVCFWSDSSSAVNPQCVFCYHISSFNPHQTQVISICLTSNSKLHWSRT